MKFLELSKEEREYFWKLRTDCYQVFFYVLSKLKDKQSLTTRERQFLNYFNSETINLKYELGESKMHEDFENQFRKIDLEDFRVRLINFFMENKISLFYSYLDPKKSKDCFAFVFRILEDGIGVKFEQKNIPNSDVETDLFEQIGYVNCNFESINDMRLKKPIEIGDIIVYRQGERADHIGFVVSSDLQILSKEGSGFLWITPYNSFSNIRYSYGGIISIMRVKDERFQKYFNKRFLKALGKMKIHVFELILEIKQILDEIDN